MFNGISCGRVALDRANIPVEHYVSYEIDKVANNVSKSNYPNDEYHTQENDGDVTVADFTKHKGFDLLIGGSPCQGFSFIGKQLNFNDPRSRLFFEYVRALKETQPKYFLLENVNMKHEYQDIISEQLGVKPVKINSSTVSAQNRVRLYWTNIPFEKPCNMVHKQPSSDLYNEIKLSNWSQQRLIKLEEKYGYIPEKFNLYNLSEIKNVYPCLTALSQGQTMSSSTIRTNGNKYYELNADGWEVLQTLPQGYTDKCGLTNNQRKKLIGNGWTVDVVASILSQLKVR